jgi:hypothetical protein
MNAVSTSTRRDVPIFVFRVNARAEPDYGAVIEDLLLIRSASEAGNGRAASIAAGIPKM